MSAAAPTAPTLQAPPLAELTTLRVGGRPRRVVEARTESELVAAVADADASGEPVLLVAGGSNLLAADGDLDVVVVRVLTRGVELQSADACGGAALRVAAGEPWDDLVAHAVAHRYVGIEALSGIPGSTGATPVQNVGAYGQEVSQTIASVRVWDRRERRIRTLANVELGFAYRHSVLKADPGRHVVLTVDFQLPLGDVGTPVRYPELARVLGVEPGGRAPLADVRDAVLALRRGKGMVLDPADHDTWSAGSFFTNPVLEDASVLPEGAPRFDAGNGRVKTSAAWLIERAGFGRGHGLPGAASLSTKHTLALTNRGDASAADLLALAREVRDGVRERFGIDLVNEPVLVGCSL